ncbi:MAG: dienelactone hydrolase family protein [Phycisphaeraceae bacterium]
MKRFATLLTCLMMSLPMLAELKTETITYNDGDTVLTGFLAWDDGLHETPDAAPAVLIVHQWMGLTDYEKGRAKQLAKLGYVAFALDIYGTDFKPTNMQEAGKASGAFKNNRDLFRKRLNIGLDQLQQLEVVDTKRIAAIGYCFCGTGVLELARSGAEVAGVVSFHGGLDAPTPKDAKNIKAKVLVLHGADDPFVPQEGIDAMKKSFNDVKVDWQMIEYSGAVHSFTQPMAGNDNARGAAYNAKADKRSWHHMRTFFNEVIGSRDIK